MHTLLSLKKFMRGTNSSRPKNSTIAHSQFLPGFPAAATKLKRAQMGNPHALEAIQSFEPFLAR
jgi:hypothetical protein